MAESVLEVVFKGVDQSLSSTANGIGNAFGRVGGAIKAGLVVGATAVAGLAVGAVALGSKLVDLGANANETGSLIQTSLGGATDSFNSRLKEFATEANRSFFELQQGSSTVIAMTKAMGAGEAQAGDFGVTFAQMTSDLGSFFNRADADVFLDLTSALGGSSETLQKYGVDIRETTLKQMALNQGLITSASDVLPPLIRAQLIQQAITEQAADAMGDAIRTSDSWSNSMRGLKARITDAATEAGQKLIPAITPLLQLVGDLAARGIDILSGAFERLLPYITEGALFIQNLVEGIQSGMEPLDAFNLAWGTLGLHLGLNVETIQMVREKLAAIVEIFDVVKAKVMEFLAPIIEWIGKNVELSDVLIALAVVLGGIVLSAIVSIATALAPVVLGIAALIGIVALLRTAWEQNWGGIQEKTAALWAFLQPILQNLISWLQVNIPIALEFLKNVWETVLLPAIQAVWTWLETVLMPFIMGVLVPWLQENIPAAIQVLSDFWNNTLLPALKQVADFIATYMMPYWQALADFFSTVFTLALTALTGTWQNVLLPALTAAYEFIKDKLGPIFEWLKNNVIDPVRDSFGGLGQMIQDVTGFIKDLTTGLQDVQLPDWMTPGSPTPWEIGLQGVRNQMALLNTRELPGLQANLQGFNQSGATNQRTVNNNQTFNWSVNTASFNPESAGRAAAAFATGGI